MAVSPLDRDDMAVAALRVLSAQQVEQARSGHPGMPLGAADVAFVLWTRFLRHMPDDPQWIARDRFILSAGHASALLYSLLHLSGYGLDMDDLIRFRQLGSRTPGHPEHAPELGIEMTTGPLGQGLGASVGMALGLKILEERFRSPAFPGLGSRVFVLASDGDMMEGISSEAGSLAAHLGLDNLVVIYDSNRVTIDGSTELSFTEDVGQRFRAFGWHVTTVNGQDRPAIESALHDALDGPGVPKLLIAETVLAKHVPGGEGDHRLHGSPLGPQRLDGLKRAVGWPETKPFSIPEIAYEPFMARVGIVREEYDSWRSRYESWRSAEPDRAAELDAMFTQAMPENLDTLVAQAVGQKEQATRLHSAAVLGVVMPTMPWLVGGSADLTESNGLPKEHLTRLCKGSYTGQTVHFGIREHAMAAAANGLALLGAFRPFIATFLTFSDYLRPSMRLAALMKLPVIYLFSHDSIFLGEDGPTHQPVEHLASLRALPNLTVMRPADGPEVAASWAWALRSRSGPIAIILSRQRVPVLPRASTALPSVERGAYVLVDHPEPAAVVVATGSEVGLAVAAAEIAQRHGVSLRVVSMPSMELFMGQGSPYRDTVLPPRCPVVGIEAAGGFGWERITGKEGLFIGVIGFGASAPADLLRKAYGLDPEPVARQIMNWLSSQPDKEDLP
ncbi:transketolase [Candidatus Fermentibacteria bacterium]|nr:transketolase [Candidatus Fermentibacteria bacterium]